VFHESSSAFYPFAALVLLGGSSIGGITAALRTMTENKRKKALFVSSSIVFVILIILGFLSYVVVPVFSYQSTQIPASCMNNAPTLPSSLNYTIPGIGTGILLTNDTKSAAVVMISRDNPTSNSTFFLVNKSNNQIIESMKFNNDIIGAAISNGVLYMFNDKILYNINARNGESVKNVIETDNYRGLYTSNNASYLQTTLEISALNANGSVLSHLKLSLRSIAFGCFIP
jgi:hypothetical protein